MSARAVGRELRFALIPLLAVIVLSWVLARRQIFVGSYDTEQFFWQAENLLRVLATGDPILRTAFLGVETPYTYTPSMHVYLMPTLALARLTNPWFAVNVMALSIPVLNGAAMYALLRVGSVARGPSLLGGWLYAFGPHLFGRTFVHPFLAEGFWLPAIFYLAWRDKTAGYRVWHWLCQGTMVALMFGSHEYLGIAGGAVVALILACAWPRLGGRGCAAAAAWTALPFLVITAPMFWLYAAQIAFDRAHGIHFERPLYESIVLSSAPSDYVVPSSASALCRLLPGVWKGGWLTESFNYLGLVNMATLLTLSAWALVRRDRLRALLEASPLLRRMRRELSLTMLGAFVASLGPRLKPGGRLWLPVAFLMALHVPPFTMLRGWARFGWIVFFVLTLVTAHLVAYLGVRRRWLVALAVLATLDQIPFATLPTFRVALPSAIATIRDTPGDFFVLHLPFNAAGGSLHHGVGQVLTFFHGKRLGGGYASFDNPLFFEMVMRSPLAGLDVRTIGQASPLGLRDWLVAHDVRFLIYEKHTQFHTDWYTPDLDRRVRAITCAVIASMGLEIVEDDDDYAVYRLPVRGE